MNSIMKKSLSLSLMVLLVFMSLAFTAAESELSASDTAAKTTVNAQVRTDNANVRAPATTEARSAPTYEERKENIERKLDKAEERIENKQEMLEARSQKIVKFRERIKEKEGELTLESKYRVQVRELNPEHRTILAGKINAKTGLNLSADDLNNKTTLRAYLSNGLQADVKVMPDRASAVALKRLRAKCAERNCTVELKEISRGNKTMLAYEVQTDKDSRLFFIFKKRMMVHASVDAETGEIILAKKPWWAFLAKEQNSVEEDIDAEVGLSTEANATVNSSA